MKKIQILFAVILTAGMLSFTSCNRDTGRTNESGSAAGVEANGQINGSDASDANAESGAAAGEKVNEDGSANDTVQPQGAANMSAPAGGAPMSKE